jgi:hypothetical protein
MDVHLVTHQTDIETSSPEGVFSSVWKAEHYIFQAAAVKRRHKDGMLFTATDGSVWAIDTFTVDALLAQPGPVKDLWFTTVTQWVY